MKIITGGRYNGKKEYVMKELGIAEDLIFDMGSRRITNPSDIPENALALYHTEAFIRDTVSSGADPFCIIKAFVDSHPDIIVICDETGSGVIPISKEEEEYREAVGRTMCRLTSLAGGLTRIICGIPEEMKP